MKIAISGLGKMGSQIAAKLIKDGHDVVGHDISRGPVERAASFGAQPAYTEAAVVSAFGGEPVVVWVMIPAQFIDNALDMWAQVLPKNSVVIDGGNSDYRLDPARAKKLADRGIWLIDIGTSGGIWGIENGFSMMVGGHEDAFAAIEPMLATLAKPHGGYRHFGPSGAGHYVKMVHNAIEYGMMEALAEGYQLLREGPYSDLDLAAIGDVWQESSVVTSWLNDLTRQILADNPTLTGIDGVVAESGEARWALETAQGHDVPLPVIQTSLDVRVASQQGAVDFRTKLLAALRNRFGGHDISGSSS